MLLLPQCSVMNTGSRITTRSADICSKSILPGRSPGLPSPPPVIWPHGHSLTNAERTDHASDISKRSRPPRAKQQLGTCQNYKSSQNKTRYAGRDQLKVFFLICYRLRIWHSSTSSGQLAWCVSTAWKDWRPP